jgi:hypothetical protein
MRHVILFSCVLTGLGFGCGGQRPISGQLDMAAVGHSQAELIALRSDGNFSRTAVASDGTFHATLEPGMSYSLAFKDPTVTYGGHFGQLVFRGQRAHRSTIHVQDGRAIDIGRVTKLSLQHATSGSDDDAEDHDDREESCNTPTTAPTTTRATQPTGSASGSGSTGSMRSFLVAGQNDMAEANGGGMDDAQDHDALADTDGDDRPDALEDDPNHTGTCEHHDDGEHETEQESQSSGSTTHSDG